MQAPTRFLLVGLVWLCALGYASRALAQADDDELIEQGVRLRREGKDQEALALFRQAFEQRSSPRAAAQVGLAEQALAKWVDAERDLVAALREGNDPWITRNRVFLERSLAVVREHLGTVQIDCDVAEATLIANGVESGSVSASGIRVPAGDVLVEVLAPGYSSKRLNLTVSPGQLVREAVQIDPMPPVPSATASSSEGKPSSPQPGADGKVPASEVAMVSKPDGAGHWAGWRQPVQAFSSQKRSLRTRCVNGS